MMDRGEIGELAEPAQILAIRVPREPGIPAP